ncbi:MAG: hypothetical protein FJ138_04785 [Deltaproteobacteria bacterium]|nr:hypothetical protein [Deltaproteobacteria bacterium]
MPPLCAPESPLRPPRGPPEPAPEPVPETFCRPHGGGVRAKNLGRRRGKKLDIRADLNILGTTSRLPSRVGMSVAKETRRGAQAAQGGAGLHPVNPPSLSPSSKS